MPTPVIDWIRLSPRWTAILTPDRQRALSQLSAADQKAFFDGLETSLSDADPRNDPMLLSVRELLVFADRSKESAHSTPAFQKMVDKVFSTANRQFDEYARSKGIKLPETMFVA
jgi:hypothetical protein